MTTLKFKTNIKCGGCIATVTPFINEVTGIEKWEVDTTTADKILTVETESTPASSIEQAVTKAGYTIEAIN